LNEKIRVWIKSGYGYGAKGDKKLSVPPNSDLRYDIELHTFDNETPSADLKEDKKIERGQQRKDLGNLFFKREDTRRAVKAYEAVISLFDNLDDFKGDEKGQARALKATAFGNLSAVKLKQKDWLGVIEQSTKALELEPKNAKVLFRRAQAQAHRGENAYALTDIKQALELEPSNTAIINLKNAVQLRITKHKEKERKLFGGFFNKVKLVDESELPPVSKDTAEKPEASEDTAEKPEASEDTAKKPKVEDDTEKVKSEDTKVETSIGKGKAPAKVDTSVPNTEETNSTSPKRKGELAKKKKAGKGPKKAQKSKDSAGKGAPKAKKERTK